MLKAGMTDERMLLSAVSYGLIADGSKLNA